MKIKVKASEISYYQRVAEARMKWIQIQYEELLDPIFHNTNGFKILYERFKSLFSWPPSLRFYHFGEQLTEDKNILKEAEILRKAWHSWWGVSHQFDKIEGVLKGEASDCDIFLNSYESSNVIILRQSEIDFKARRIDE